MKTRDVGLHQLLRRVKTDPAANLLDPFESTEDTYMLRENLAAVKHGIVYSVYHHLVVFVYLSDTLPLPVYIRAPV